MNWYSNVVPPKIKALIKREAPENLWVKCPDSGQLVFHKDIEANLFVVPGSGYHMRCPVDVRLTNLFDNGELELLPTPEAPVDPLKFRDIKRYVDKLKEYRAKTGAPDEIGRAHV
jgi:acetyl-CoA carboxylase carboxyl transferase subunit beta